MDNSIFIRMLAQTLRKGLNTLDKTHFITARIKRTKGYSNFTDAIKDRIEEKTHIHIDRSYERKTIDIHVFKNEDMDMKPLEELIRQGYYHEPEKKSKFAGLIKLIFLMIAIYIIYLMYKHVKYKIGVI